MDSPQLVTDWTRDSDALMHGLTRVATSDAESGGAIYDSCALAHQKLVQRETLRSVILLITDGQDTASQLTYSDLRESFGQPDALIYSICRADHGASLAESGIRGLEKLSAISGGSTYVVSSANEVTKVLERIAAELRHQYLIGYWPLDARRDGTWHPVKVTAYSMTLDAVPLPVRSLSGYYAPNESALSRQD